jgi:HAD superfamily hydrolase (TIGR01549 family)
VGDKTVTGADTRPVLMSSLSPATGHRYALVIFDMDGTLTEELLDFDAIRREIGVPAGVGILEYISHLPAAQKGIAQDILHRHEIAAAEACVLHEGAAEVLTALKRSAIRTALLTRNSSACASSVLARHQLTLDFVATRENLPHKPHADSILNITRHFRILPEQTLMVGDYLYDLQAAKNAGVDAALVCLKPGPLPEFASMAKYVVRSLKDLVGLAVGAR